MEFKRWTDNEISYLKENYKEKSYKEIGAVLGRKEEAIRSKMHYLGIKKEIHHCNYDYFQNIDTEDKAYWLGFIYADGNINKAENTLTIQLKGSDFKHLQKLNKNIKGNFNVRVFDVYKYDKIYSSCKILIYSKKIVKDLESHGVYPNKTLTILFPNIPKEFYCHFIRGYFDGDGSVCERKHKKRISDLACSFTCGNEDFLNSIRKILFDNNIKSYIVKENDKKYYLSLAGISNPDTFLHYIYDNAVTFLDRKFEKTKYLYKHLNIEQRLLRHSEMSGSFINEEESGNPEMGIRVEGNK